MAPGLLFVYTDVGAGPVTEEDYHDWYDHEHGPARLTVPGLLGASRYQALDDLTPRWLALYQLSGPGVPDSPEYKAVLEGGSDRDKFIMSHLATLDRRIYEQISEDGPGGDGPAPVILAVANSVPADMEDDMTAWYQQEHIPMLLEVPGWRRIRRYRLIGGSEPPGPDFLSLHELAGPAVLEEPAYRAAVSQHYFSLIIVSFNDTAQTDGEIVSDMGTTGDYRVVAVAPSTVGQYTIWAYEPPSTPGSHGHG